MSFKVVASKSAWAGFLRRAKQAHPKEYTEALWGIPTVDAYRITDFKRIKCTNTDATSIQYDNDEVKRQVAEAVKAGREFLGTIHTHPSDEYDTTASVADHHSAVRDGERIMGVVLLYRKKGKYVVKIDWWLPQPKIEFDLVAE